MSEANRHAQSKDSPVLPHTPTDGFAEFLPLFFLLRPQTNMAARYHAGRPPRILPSYTRAGGAKASAAPRLDYRPGISTTGIALAITGP